MLRIAKFLELIWCHCRLVLVHYILYKVIKRLEFWSKSTYTSLDFAFSQQYLSIKHFSTDEQMQKTFLIFSLVISSGEQGET